MAYKPYKMKGSPMQRNYGIGSPAKQKHESVHDTIKKVDPDAPGTPGKPGYEPPVKREDLDEKGKKLWDELRIKKEEKKMKKVFDSEPGSGTSFMKKKSPNKWAQFIPMALSAISSMKKKKE